MFREYKYINLYYSILFGWGFFWSFLLGWGWAEDDDVGTGLW